MTGHNTYVRKHPAKIEKLVKRCPVVNYFKLGEGANEYS